MELKSFEKYYENLLGQFDQDGLLYEIKPKEAKIEWPDKTGVYVVWDLSGSNRRLVYVGLTGKFVRSKVDNTAKLNRSTFKTRTNRWTPYRFCENNKDAGYIFHFRFGPKYSSSGIQSKAKYDEDGYEEAIPYGLLEIHCFEVNADHNKYTPILLESEILTRYLKTFGDLPVANNSL